MITPYVWWQSRYDHRAHAFPVAQAAEQDRTSYNAVCTHTVTATTVIRRHSGDSCLACAFIVGSPVPDPQPVSATVRF
jgi:hypothetical protein